MKRFNLKFIAGLAACFVFAGVVFAQGTKKETLPEDTQERIVPAESERRSGDFPAEPGRQRPMRPHPEEGEFPKMSTPQDASEELPVPEAKNPPRGKRPAPDMLQNDGEPFDPDMEARKPRREKPGHEGVDNEPELAPDADERPENFASERKPRRGKRGDLKRRGPRPERLPEPSIVGK